MKILTIKEDKRTNALLGYKGWVTHYRLKTNDFVLSNTTLKIYGVILQTIDECKEYAKNNTPIKKKFCKDCGLAAVSFIQQETTLEDFLIDDWESFVKTISAETPSVKFLLQNANRFFENNALFRSSELCKE